MQIFKYVNIFNLICFFCYNIEAGIEAVSLRLLKCTLLCFAFALIVQPCSELQQSMCHIEKSEAFFKCVFS